MINIYWIEQCWKCSCDHLTIADNEADLYSNSTTFLPSNRYCSEKSLSFTPSVSNLDQIFIRFKTDHSISRPKIGPIKSLLGFSIFYQELKKEKHCKEIESITNLFKNITISSLELVKNQKLNCKWLIKAAVGYVVRLNFTTLYKHPKQICPSSSNQQVITFFNVSTDPDRRVVLKQIQFPTVPSKQLTMTLSNQILIELQGKIESKYGGEHCQYWQINLEQTKQLENVTISAITREGRLKIARIFFLTLLSILSILLSVFICKKIVEKKNKIGAFVVNSSVYGSPISPQQPQQLTFTDVLMKKNHEENGKHLSLIELIEKYKIDISKIDRLEEETQFHGNFGSISKCWLKENSDETGESNCFAIKTSLNTGFENSLALLNEALIMSKLNHCNVLPLKAILIVDNQPRLILPMMENGDLRTFLFNRQNNEIENEILLKFCIEICRGMEHLAGKNVVHRDLACRNILVDGSWSMKISDFGMAVVLTNDNQQGYSSAKGTYNGILPVRWHPPESLQMNVFRKKSDVWTFGVVMWEIFTGCKQEPYSHIDDASELSLLVCSGLRLEKPERITTHL